MNDNEPRWTAKLTYLHNDGPRTSLITFDELYELHQIVEDGPDFYSIISIEIIINTNKYLPRITVEEAMSR